jgi:imidazolonepropionase-like amidohydrolase
MSVAGTQQGARAAGDDAGRGEDSARQACWRIEAGKVANLVVTNGDAMEIRSRVMHVIIAGKDVPLQNKQTELFNRYMGRQ